MIRPVRGILFLSLIPLVTMGVVGSASSATTSHPRPLRLALKPGVQAGERILLTVRAASPQTFAKSKNDLLGEINVVLNSLNSVKRQMRSAPADVGSSFDRDLSVEENFKKAVWRASTKGQIMLASRTLGSDTAEVLPIMAYVLFQCEGSRP